jgi:oligosaccharide repeat unit polymerase
VTGAGDAVAGSQTIALAGADEVPRRRRGRRFDPANPLFVYAGLWTFILLLASIRLTNQLLPLNVSTVLVVLANIGTAFFLYAAATGRRRRRRLVGSLHDDARALPVLRRLVRSMAVLWIAGTAVEIVIAGGLPIVWVLLGRTDKDYRNFGLPTFHGLMMATYLFMMTSIFLDYCMTHRRVLLIQVGLLLIWPVVLVNRGAAVWALLELTAVYLLTRRVSGRRVARVAAVALVAVIAFGLLGDFRAGGNRALIRGIVRPEYREVTGYLPSGFIWVYLYVTAPINNVVAGIDSLKPNYVLYYSVANLVPTVIRDRVFTRTYPLSLVNEAFNTSTWYASFLSDLGIAPAILIVALLQWIAIVYYVRARQREAPAILAYAALFQGLALSIFADTFTSLVALAQLGFAWYYRRALLLAPHPQ